MSRARTTCRHVRISLSLMVSGSKVPHYSHCHVFVVRPPACKITISNMKMHWALAQWLALSPNNNKVVSVNPGWWPFYVECVCSLGVLPQSKDKHVG